MGNSGQIAVVTTEKMGVPGWEVENLLPFMKPEGYFFSGHLESLTGMVPGLVQVKPAIYRRLQ